MSEAIHSNELPLSVHKGKNGIVAVEGADLRYC
jgi:hypothetical protein